MPLNRAQQETVSFFTGPAMVLAGPGSGKTTVITRRIKELVEKRGVNPSEILVITFTRAAAEEMKQRYETLYEGRNEPVTFGTFHSVFFYILRCAYHYDASQIIRPEQKREIIRQLLRESYGESNDESELTASLIAEISSVKGEGGEISSYHSQCCPDEMFARVFEGYGQRLREMRMIDFDDMMIQCRDLFVKREDILRQWQRRFSFILIDEFQDINRLQYDVMKMLALPQNNIFVVGDDDQSIYRFRGARPEIMLGFPKDYPSARTLMLDVNYRSTPQIVNAASRLISCNHSRYKKNLRANSAEGTDIVFKLFNSSADENFQVLRDIVRYHEQGIAYNEMAILFRTNNDPRAMVETLIRMNYHFHMKDVVPNLYEHWVARDILTYMIIGAGSRERGDLLRIINRPSRYIRRSDITDKRIDLDELEDSFYEKPWIAERVRKLKKDIEILSGMEPYAAVNYIRRGIGYEQFLKEYAEFRRIRPDELVEVLEELQEASKPYSSLQEWLAHIRSYSDELKEKRKSDQVQDGVWITTMHAAKGLEYKVVFILDADEGVTPHRRSSEKAELEEERRLFYVAMTRAKKFLHIYSSRKRCGKDASVSRFVSEALGEDRVLKESDGELAGSTDGLRSISRNDGADGDGSRKRLPRSSGKAVSYSDSSPVERGRDILKNGWHI